MKKHAPINIIVHYPKTEEGKRELGRRVASMRATIVCNKIRKEDWKNRQDEELSWRFCTVPAGENKAHH